MMASHMSSDDRYRYMLLNYYKQQHQHAINMYSTAVYHRPSTQV